MALTAVEVEVGRPVRVTGEPVAGDANSVGVSSAGAAVTVTVSAPAAGSGQFILIERLDISYSAAPTAGRITVTDGTNTFFDLDLTTVGPFSFVLNRRITKETAASIVLAGGGGSVVGKVNVLARLIK